jgi:hypothetical protein
MYMVRGFPHRISFIWLLIITLELLDSLTALKDDLTRLKKPMTRWSNELAKITDGLDRTSTITCETHI